MEEKIRLAVFGQKRLSREGGIEIVVKELCTRMAQNGCDITCYNRAGHHVSGAEYDKTIEYDGIRQKVVPTIEKKGLAAVSSSFFAALCSAFGRYDVVHWGIIICLELITMKQLSWNIRLEDYMIAIEAVSLEWLMQIILRDIQFKQQSWLFLISMLTIVRVAHISLMSFSINMRRFLSTQMKIMRLLR